MADGVELQPMADKAKSGTNASPVTKKRGGRKAATIASQLPKGWKNHVPEDMAHHDWRVIDILEGLGAPHELATSAVMLNWTTQNKGGKSPSMLSARSMTTHNGASAKSSWKG